MSGGLGDRGIEQALLVLLRRPADGIEQPQPGNVRAVLTVEGDPGPVGEHGAGFKEIDLFVFADERDHIAGLAAGPAAVVLEGGINLKGRAVVVVERAETLEHFPLGLQRHIRADHGHDVAGFLDLLGQGYPVFRQGTPAGEGPTGPTDRA